MSRPSPIPENFGPLLSAACDDALSESQVSDLEVLLASNPELRAVFVDHFLLETDLQFFGRTKRACHGGLAGVRETFLSDEAPSLGGLSEKGAGCERSDAATNDSRSAPVPLLQPDTTVYTSSGVILSGWPVAYLLATVIFALGLSIAAFTYVSESGPVASQSASLPSPLFPLPSVVARITGMVDCVWEDANLPSLFGRGAGGESRGESNSPLSTLHSPLVHLGDRLALRSGLLELTYDTGAKVILQGPVRYEIESPAGGYLSLGKLTARLEKGSGISANPKRQRGSGDEDNGNSPLSPLPSPLFAVRTPTAIVTDLGTEFGVEVDKGGSTTSHVFRGSVCVQVVADDGNAVTTEDCSRILRENESVRIDGSAEHKIVALGNMKHPHFLREIPKQKLKILDLGDIVAGGDGFSGGRNQGIDPRNGAVVSAPAQEQFLIGNDSYHPVAARPFIDGVFIPHGNDRGVRLDSAGHSFAGFHAVENKTKGFIWSGVQPNCRSVLNGVDYSSSGHGMIAMHANKAITFNLDAIRRANRGWRLLRFRSAAGISAMFGSGNLLGNGDFTTGIDSWITGGKSGRVLPDTSSPDGHNMVIEGPYEAYCNMPSASIQARQRYTVSFMAASPDRSATNGPYGCLVVRLWWVRGDDSRSFIMYNVPADALNRGWATYTTTSDVPAGHDGDSLQVSFDGAGTGTKEHIAIDNVSVVASPPQGITDFRIFVDGQTRFARREINQEIGMIPVVTPIGEGDRFLTLTVTDGGDGVGSDGMIFGDPQIEMSLIATRSPDENANDTK